MTVRNWRRTLGEKIQFITPDGLKYELHDPPKRAIMEMNGWGIPEANISATQGPFQHGLTPLSIRLPHREITMTIRRNGCSRNDYWAIRRDLNNHLRLSRTNLNLPVPSHLRRYLSDGRIRQLDVMIASGPGYSEGGDTWDGFSFMEELTFIAHNPIIYYPVQRTASTSSLACTPTAQLQFPFAFGGSLLTFGTNICVGTDSLYVNYEGDWEEFPTITVTGPGDDFMIEHAQTGMKIMLDYSIAAGETITFDLTYNKKTIINNFGVSLLGYLTEDSNLGAFSLQPDPIASNGLNTLDISIFNATTDTNVQVAYYDRYQGI